MFKPIHLIASIAKGALRFVVRPAREGITMSVRHLSFILQRMGRLSPPHPGHRRSSVLLAAAMLFALTLFAPGITHAHCVYVPPITQAVDLSTVISGGFTVGRDVAIGQPIATFTVTNPLPDGTSVLSCDTPGLDGYVVVATPHGLQEPTWHTFPTSVPGIGVRLFKVGTDPNNALPNAPQAPYGAPLAMGTGSHFTLQFVKTAAVVGAGTVLPSDLPTWQFSLDGGAVLLYNFPVSGSIQFQQGACQTPDVRVPLGWWPQTTFSGIGSTSGTKPLTISLNSCPAGLNSIAYRIDPVTTVVNVAQSVVALDASSSATGVGVQLLDSTGTQPFPLQTWTTFTGYNAGTGGNYTILLNARYYQVSAAIAPGPANSSMTFTMQYQ